MTKNNNKIKKSTNEKNKSPINDNANKVEIENEEVEKENNTLSDGVLDAFDELAPVDPLLEDETILPENEEDDEIDSGDYRPLNEW